MISFPPISLSHLSLILFFCFQSKLSNSQDIILGISKQRTMRPSASQLSKKKRKNLKKAGNQGKDNFLSLNSEQADFDFYDSGRTEKDIWASLPSVIKQTLGMAYLSEQKRKGYEKRQLAYRQEQKKLDVLQSAQVLPHDSRTITYQVKGSKNRWKSSARRLKQIQQVSSREQSQQPYSQQNSRQLSLSPIKKLPRYFDDIQHHEQTTDQEYDDKFNQVRCFRCRKIGHVARVCSMKPEVKCQYCLEEHAKQLCQNVVCKKCCEVGHLQKQCSVDQPYCYLCKKMGHSQKACGRIIISRNSIAKLKVQNIISKEAMDKVECLNCHEYGHFNCHKYQDSIPQIYQNLDR